jgi:hypothetical protein
LSLSSLATALAEGDGRICTAGVATTFLEGGDENGQNSSVTWPLAVAFSCMTTSPPAAAPLSLNNTRNLVKKVTHAELKGVMGRNNIEKWGLEQMKQHA